MSARPSALIFDWDNTLIDTFPVMHAAHNAVRKAMGHPDWTEGDARANIRLAAKDAFPIWYPDRAKEAEDIYSAHIRAIHLDRMEIIDGTEDLLKQARGMNIPLGIVSNKRREFLRKEIDKTGWTAYFGAIIGADDVPGPAKPNPQGIIMALDALEVSESHRAQAWYAGDTENDIKAARAARVIPVLIENLAMNSPEDIAVLRPAMTFKNPRECLAYLESLG